MTKRFIKLANLSLAKKLLRREKPQRYIYDLKGSIKTMFWDKLLSSHTICQAIFDRKTNAMYFCCFNCLHERCYYKRDKERLKREGHEYLE